MADQKVNLKDIPLATKNQLTSNDSLLGLINEGAGGTKRIRVADVQTDLTEVNSSITTLTENLSTLQTTVQGLSGLSTDIDALESHTSSSNSNVSNANLSSLINSLANKEGYEIKTSQSGNPTIGRIAPQSGDYPPLYSDPVSTSFIDILSSNILGAAPSVVSGSGDSAVYNLPYNTNNVLSSNFVLDLRKNIFDNEWIANRPYMAGTVVVYNNELYKAIQNTSSATFDATKWTKLSSGSGGGGIGGTNFEIWKRLRNLVLEGLSRELSPTYMWGNPQDSFIQYSYSHQTMDDAVTYWENNYANNLGYFVGSNGQSSDSWFDNSYTYWNESYSKTFYSESVYKNNASKIKTNLLQLLSEMIDSYLSFTDYTKDTLVAYSYGTQIYNHDTYNQIPLGEASSDYHRAGYDSFVVTDTPTYTTDSATGFPNLTSNPAYNEQSDLIKRIVSLCAPKRITGIFRAANWVTTEQRGRINWCPLTDISNPEHAHVLHSAYYSDKNPSGEDYEQCSDNGFNFIFHDAIMDVYLPGIERDTENTNNTLRKNILEAYNLIQDTNISFQPTYKSSMEKSRQFEWGNGAGDIILDRNNWSQGGDCSAIVAYLDPEAEPPTVDIPVQILIFPKVYDRNNYIPTQNNS